MNEKIESASAEALGLTEGVQGPTEGNYTRKNGKGDPRALLDEFLSTIPQEALRGDISRFIARKVGDVLKDDGADPALEGLLPKLRTVDAAAILAMEFPPIPWIIPDYLPPGLTILSGRPKIGKSWMGMQMALSVLTGGKMFGKDVQPGKVLYLALEDSERRLKDRMKLQGWPSSPGGVNFMLYKDFQEQIGSLNSTNGKRLMKFIEKGEYRLVVVDTFSRSIIGDQLDASEMTIAIGPLQQQALRMDIGLVFIDHMRKNLGNIQDPISDVFGSVAKAGVLDTTWAIYKEQGKYGAKLAISGRDVDSETIALSFQKPGFFWHCEGEAYEVELTRRRKEILEAIEELGGRATHGEIADFVEQDKGNTTKRLNDLCNSGLIRRIGVGTRTYYELIEVKKEL